MNIPNRVAYEIEHALIDEIRITGQTDLSGDHSARSLSGKLIPFNLDWAIAWQVPGKPPTRIYSITLL